MFVWSLLIIPLLCTGYVDGQQFGTVPPLPASGVRLFLGEENITIANFSMIAASLFHDRDVDRPDGSIGVNVDGPDGQNDGLWCQSSLNKTSIGTWYFPNGATVPLESGSPLYSNNFSSGQIGLLRNGGISSIQGLFTCEIPDNNGTIQILYVAIYGNADFSIIDQHPVVSNDTIFQLVSSIDDDPPVFSLSFNVTYRPPTIVSCSIDHFNVSENDLIRTVVQSEDPILVQVTVLFRRRVAGLFQCLITTDKITVMDVPSVSSATRNITVTAPPFNISYVRESIALVALSWSPSFSSNATYAIFITSINGATTVMTNNTELDLSLQPDTQYMIKLVATGKDLPSDIFSITVPSVIDIHIEGPNTLPLEIFSNFVLSCTVTLAPETNVTSIELEWINYSASTQPVTTIVNGNIVYTLNLTFNQLQASHVGNYTCRALLMDDSESISVSNIFTVSVKVPTPMVIMSSTPGQIFESSKVSLQCNVTISPLDVEKNVGIVWFGPNGMITVNDSNYNIDIEMINSGTYFSFLNFTAMLSDNNTEYYCTTSIGPASNVTRKYLISSVNATSSNTTVVVEMVPLPVISIEAFNIPVANEPFSLVCTGATPFNVSGLAVVSIQWVLNHLPVTNGTLQEVTVTGSESMATLSFSIINATIHDNVYTCISTLSIPDVTLTRNTNATYHLLTISNPVVFISLNGSFIAGQMSILQCTVTIITGNLNITWHDESGNEISEGNGVNFNLVTVSDTVQRYNLIFNPLNYIHIGEYTCHANLTADRGSVVFNGVGSANITVQAQIPFPNVSISPFINATFFRGTTVTANCSVTLSPPLPPNTNISFISIKDGVLLNDSTRLILYVSGLTSSLIFRPVDFSDAGNYTCIVILSDADNSLIIPSSSFNGFVLTVQAIPIPIVTFNVTTGGLLGKTLVVVCTVDLLDDLYNINVNVSILAWNDEGLDIISTNTGSGDTTTGNTVPALSSSNAGDYQCTVNITQHVINYEFSSIETRQLILTIPTPSVSVGINATGQLIEGQYLDVICVANLSEYINTGVAANMAWRKNGAIIYNGDTFTISPVTVETNNQFIGILHITSLRYERDNGAIYNCSVSISTNNPLIVGNNSSDSITLTIEAFDVNHVDIDILIPFVPVAGDVFNFTCRIGVPDRFVENITSIKWTYDLGSSLDVTGGNSNATVTPFTRVGGTFYSILTLNPVRTTDARPYYCHATILIFGTVDRTNRDLTVQISPPGVSLTANPATGPIYESTIFSLTCLATINTTLVNTQVTASVVWTDPKGMVISLTETRRNVTPPSGNNFTSTLIFLPIDIGRDHNDTGAYTCHMTINSPDSLIIPSEPNSTDISIIVENLPPMTTYFSILGSFEVGQSLNMTCVVSVAERLVVTPNVAFLKINESEMEILSSSFFIMKDDTGSVTNVTLILNPLRFEDRGTYICMSDFNVTGFNNTDDPDTATADHQEASAIFNLTVDFPPVAINMSQDYDGTLYAGAAFFLVCYITLHPLVTVPVNVTNQWTRNGTYVPMGSSDNTITADIDMISTLSYKANLSFYPLDDNDDSGLYACNMQVAVPSSYMYLRNTSASANTTLIVQAVPGPLVSITSNGTANPGEQYTLSCTVSFVTDRLIVGPVLTWTKRSVDRVSVELNSISVPSVWNSTAIILSFNSLNTSDAGQYTCSAEINVTQINKFVSQNDTEDLLLEISAPLVSIDLKNDDVLLGGSLNVMCNITIHSQVNTPLTVEIVWSKRDKQNNDNKVVDDERVTVTGVMAGSSHNQYYSQLHFSILRSNDSGTYSCNVSLIPAIGYYYLMGSNSNIVSVNISINDIIAPSVVLSFNATGEFIEGQYLDIICTTNISRYFANDAMVTVIWRRNGTVLTDGNDFIVSPLNANTSTLHVKRLRHNTDNGATYNCSVTVSVISNQQIRRSKSSSAFTLSVQNFGMNYVNASIVVSPSTPIAGDNVNLTCTIHVPERFATTNISIRWTYDLEAFQDVIDVNISANVAPFTEKDVFFSVLTLSPVKTIDARYYYCHATFHIFSVVHYTSSQLIVQISSPSVSLTASPATGPIYESTSFILTCLATVNTTLVNTPVTASVLWTDPRGITIPVGMQRLKMTPPTGSSLASTVMFQPIDVGNGHDDNGTYICKMTVNSANSLISSSEPMATNITVVVEDLPPMIVQFSSHGLFEVGKSLNITCTVAIVQGLAVSPTVVVIKMNETTTEMLSEVKRPLMNDIGSVTNVTLTLNPLKFEDAGLYTCTSVFNVTGFNNTDNPNTATYDYQEVSATFNLTVDYTFPGYCASETITSDRGLFVWPETLSGFVINASCPNGPIGEIAVRKCAENDTWESPNIIRCATTEISNGFKNISIVNVTVGNIVVVSQNLSNLVISANDTADQNTENIKVVSAILSEAASLLNKSNSLTLSEVSMTTNNTLQILDSVEEWPPNIVEEQSNEIIQSFETIIDALVSQENFTNVTIVKRDIGFTGRRVAKSSFTGITFTASTSNNSLVLDTQDRGSSTSVDLNVTRIASITLPGSILNISSDDNINVAFTLYSQAVLFPIRSSFSNTVVGSSVISAKIEGVADSTRLSDPVVLRLSLKRNKTLNPRCVYWDFTAAGGSGNWSTSGCNTVMDANYSVRCYCDHLTNFACLVDISARAQGATQAPYYVTFIFEVVTYVGVCLSLVGLVLTIITLSIFKQLREKDASKFHIQLCLSLCLMLIVFVSGITEISPRSVCITVGALIHYFALVFWMWMGAEAVLMFQKLVIVFVNITWRYHLIVSIVCWGVPLIPVVIVLAVDRYYYVTLYENGNGSGYCFIGKLIPFLIAFLCPIFLVLIFNIVMYILVIRVLIQHTTKTIKRRNKSLTTSDALKMIASFTGISLLFGLTWIFAVLTFISEPTVSYIIQFFFCFFNVFQGFFIFFFFTVLSGDSRNAWKSLFCSRITSNNREKSSYTKRRITNLPYGSYGVSSPISKFPPAKVNVLTTSDISATKSEEINEVVNSDSIMLSEFSHIRINRYLSTRRKHSIEKVEIDFFDTNANSIEFDDDDDSVIIQ